MTMKRIFALVLVAFLGFSLPAFAAGPYQCFDSQGVGADNAIANLAGGTYGGYYNTGGVVWRSFDQITLPFVITRAWMTVSAQPSASKYSISGEIDLDPGAAFVTASGYPPGQTVPLGNTAPQHVIRLASIFKNWLNLDQLSDDHDWTSQSIVMQPGDALYSNVELSVSPDGSGTAATIYYAICGHTP